MGEMGLGDGNIGIETPDSSGFSITCKDFGL
jgi:hypothetical protein